jgi:hypothetical protein
MKIKIKISLIIAIISCIAILYNCKKDPNLRMPTIKKTVVPVMTIDTSSDFLIDVSNPAAFKGVIVVDKYFKTDNPSYFQLGVVFDGDLKSQAILQDHITTFPTKVNFDVAKLVSLFPAQISGIGALTKNDQFTFFINVILQDGTKINGADTLYVQSSADTRNYPNGSLSVDVGFLCTTDLNKFVGNYSCIDDQGDPADNVTTTIDPADPNGLVITGIYANSGVTDGNIKIKVNRKNFAVTVPSQAFSSDLFGYGPGNIGPGAGKANTCDLSITFAAPVTVAAGSFGTITYFLTPLKK